MAGFTDPEITFLLEDEREAERRFVAEAASEPDFPRGWSAALLMAHIASWRTRLRDSLIEASRGLPVSGPPSDIDVYNAAELARIVRKPAVRLVHREDRRRGTPSEQLHSSATPSRRALCGTRRPITWGSNQGRNDGRTSPHRRARECDQRLELGGPGVDPGPLRPIIR